MRPKTGRKRVGGGPRIRKLGIAFWTLGRFIGSLFRRLGAPAIGRPRLLATYCGKLTVFAFALLTLSGLAFSPGGSSATPQYPSAYEEQAPAYQPGYHQAQHRDRDWGHYPNPDDDPWPSFAVILLIIILIVLIIALFLPDIRDSRRVTIRRVVETEFTALSTSSTAADLARARNAILNAVNA
jgi:hypothetical protein